MEALLVSSVASYGVSAFITCIVEAIRSIGRDRELFEEMEELLERMEHVAAKTEQQKNLDVTVRNWNKALGRQLERAKAVVLEHYRLKSSIVGFLKRLHVQKKLIKVTAGLKDLASEAAAVSLVLHSLSWRESRPTSPIRNSSGDRSTETTVSRYESYRPSSIRKYYGDCSSDSSDSSDSSELTIVSGNGNHSYNSNTIISGNGNRSYNSGHNSNTIISGNGNRSYNSGHNSNTIIKGNGNYSYNSGHNSNTIVSGNGNYCYNSGYNSNIITGGNGNYVSNSSMIIGGTGNYISNSSVCITSGNGIHISNSNMAIGGNGNYTCNSWTPIAWTPGVWASTAWMPGV